MNPIVKQKWINALNSGEYKKGKGALRRSDDTFCCLGVLCDLYRKEHPEEEGWIKQETEFGKVFKFRGNNEGLPSVVVEWANLLNYGQFDKMLLVEGWGYYPMFQLTEVNDQTDLSFKEIAKIIDKEF